MGSLDLKPKADHDPISHDLDELNSCLKVPSGTSTSAASTTAATCAIRNAILERKNIDTTFESFPYSLRECTKKMLVAACIIPLKYKEQQNCCQNLSVLSSHVLLTGPPEIYQETLAKALAHYFDAKLLIYDHRCLLDIISCKEADALKDGFNTSTAKQSSTSAQAAQAFKLGDNVKFCCSYGKHLPSLSY